MYQESVWLHGADVLIHLDETVRIHTQNLPMQYFIKDTGTSKKQVAWLCSVIAWTHIDPGAQVFKSEVVVSIVDILYSVV